MAIAPDHNFDGSFNILSGITVSIGATICVWCLGSAGGNSALNVSSISLPGAGTFTKRNSLSVFQSLNNLTFSVELWWAPANSAITSQTITVNWSRAPGNSGTVVQSFTGVGAVPFDPGAAVKAANDSTSGGTGTDTLTTTTTIANDMLIGVTAAANNIGSVGTPANFSQDAFQATNQPGYSAGHRLVTTATAYAEAWPHGGAVWMDMQDALQPAPPVTVLGLAAGSYLITGAPATFAIVEPWAAGSYTINGAPATFTIVESWAVGSYTINGAPATFAIVEPWDVGAYSISGASALFQKTIPLPGAQGAYVMTGQAAALLGSYILNAAPGAYLLTGFPTTPDILMPFAPGVYVVNGDPSTGLISRTIFAAPGAYTIGGDAALLKRFFEFPTDVGIYTMDGASSAIRLEGGFRLFTWDVGIYSMSGKDAYLSVFTPSEIAQGKPGGLAPKDPRVSRAELELFRGLAYRRMIDALVPPAMVAVQNLTTSRYPGSSRPVIVPAPQGKPK